MPKKIAFAVATALTMFVVITMAALYATLTTTEATAKESQNDVPTESQVEAMNISLIESSTQSREDLYKQQLDRADALITKMQSQVETLKQRESIYQQRLEEANQELVNSLDPGAVEQDEELYRQQLVEAEVLLDVQSHLVMV